METPLRTVRTNIVQSIHCFSGLPTCKMQRKPSGTICTLSRANAQTKQDVLDLIGQQFKLPSRSARTSMRAPE